MNVFSNPAGLKSRRGRGFATLTEDRRKIPDHGRLELCRQYDAFKARKFFLSPIRGDRATLAHSYYLNPCGMIPKPKLSATAFPGTLGEAPGARGHHIFDFHSATRFSISATACALALAALPSWIAFSPAAIASAVFPCSARVRALRPTLLKFSLILMD